MNITTFDDLLLAARQQREPQRLLLAFAGASLPDGATAEQRAQFEAGESGELTALMCVDKDPLALSDFAALATEAQAMGLDWALVFAAALAGQGGQAPDDGQVEKGLKRLVEAVSSGRFDGLIPFDRQGQAVSLG